MKSKRFYFAFLALIFLTIISCRKKRGINTHNSTVDIQKLLQKGGKIVLPAGEFYIKEQVIINKSNTELIGAGMDKTTIHFSPGIGINLSASFVKISNIHFTGTYKSDGHEQHTLNVNGPYTNINFDRLKITNGDDTGIRIGYSTGSNGHGGRIRKPASHCSITNCIIGDIKEGSGIEVMSATHVKIKNNIISNTYENGIRIAGGSNCDIENNKITNYNLRQVRYAYGIYAKGGNGKYKYDFCSDNNIIGNTISGKGKNISIGTQTKNITISKNILKGESIESSVGISLENNLNNAQFGYRNIIIENNEINGKYWKGIDLQTRDNDPAVSGENVYIKDNIISGYSQYAITIRGNNFGEVKNIYVERNTFDDLSPKEFPIVVSKCKDIFVRNNVDTNAKSSNAISNRKESKIFTKW